MLLAEPFRVILTYVNGITIGITGIIRAFTGLNEEVSFANQTQGLADYNEELERANSNLLSFDKFEALSSNKGIGAGNLDVTKALVGELQRQKEEYDKIVKSMGIMNNEAVDIAKHIKDWFIVTDKDGKFVKWTDNATTLLAVVTALTSGLLLKGLIKLGKAIFGIKVGMEGLAIASNVLRTTGIFLLIFAISKLVYSWDDLNNEQRVGYILLGVLSAALIVFSNKTLLQTLVGALAKVKVSTLGVLGVATAALGVGFAVGELLKGLAPEVRVIAGVMFMLTGAVFAVAYAMGALQSTLTLGLGIAGIVAGIVAITSAIDDMQSKTAQYKKNGGTFDTRGGFALGVVDEDESELVYSNSARQIEVNNQESLAESFLTALLKYNEMTSDDKAKIKVVIEDKSSFAEFTRKVTPAVMSEGKRIGALK